MVEISMEKLDDFYEAAIAKAQQPWEFNDYGSERSQKRRFSVAVNALGIRSRDVVIDVGCGSGEFKQYLWAEGIDVLYKGYDSVPAMVELAARYDIDVELFDVFNKQIGVCDQAICLGVLGVLPGTDAERMIKLGVLFGNLCATARVGVAVTAQLYKEGLDKNGLRWYMELDEVAEVLKYLRKEHSDFGWQLLMDYHPHDVMFVGKSRSF